MLLKAPNGTGAGLSWVLAAETRTVIGSPARSETAWIFEPGLPRSTGSARPWCPVFSALTHATSSTALDQSSSLWPPSSSSTARCGCRHRPAIDHSSKRRCAVGTVTPNEGGKRRHAHPLVHTNTTAANTARSSTRDLPPTCGRPFDRGSNGSTNAHNSSGTSRIDNASTTSRDHARHPKSNQMRHAISLNRPALACGGGLVGTRRRHWRPGWWRSLLRIPW